MWQQSDNLCGQYDVEDWHERLEGGTQADSIMDRIIRNSYTIPTTDNNLRMVSQEDAIFYLYDNIDELFLKLR